MNFNLGETFDIEDKDGLQRKIITKTFISPEQESIIDQCKKRYRIKTYEVKSNINTQRSVECEAETYTYTYTNNDIGDFQDITNLDPVSDLF